MREITCDSLLPRLQLKFEILKIISERVYQRKREKEREREREREREFLLEKHLLKIHKRFLVSSLKSGPRKIS